jgi:hypothetical protein
MANNLMQLKLGEGPSQASLVKLNDGVFNETPQSKNKKTALQLSQSAIRERNQTQQSNALASPL